MTADLFPKTSHAPTSISPPPTGGLYKRGCCSIGRSQAYDGLLYDYLRYTLGEVDKYEQRSYKINTGTYPLAGPLNSERERF